MNDKILSHGGNKRAMAREFIKVYDEDGNGTVSKAELMNYFGKRFDEKIV